MSTATPARSWQDLSLADLRKLPATERDAILAAAAKLAESDYCNDPELTGFEAFGKDDLYGDSADAEKERVETRRNLAG